MATVWQFSSVVQSDSLQPHGLQHAKPSCPSPTPGVYSNLCPLSLWCHPTVSSSVIPFSSHLQYFPASGSFQMSQFFTSGGQNIGVSAPVSVFPMKVRTYFLGWKLPLLSHVVCPWHTQFYWIRGSPYSSVTSPQVITSTMTLFLSQVTFWGPGS